MIPYYRLTPRAHVHHGSTVLTPESRKDSEDTDTTEELLEIVRTMKNVEQRYAVLDYLGASAGTEGQQNNGDQEKEGEDNTTNSSKNNLQHAAEADADAGAGAPFAVDTEVAEHHTCRRLMCEWCYRMVDHFDLPNRFFSAQIMCQDSALHDLLYSNDSEQYHNILQIVTTTSLHLAIKAHHPGGSYYHYNNIGTSRSNYCTSMMNGSNQQYHYPTRQEQLIKLLPYFTQGKCSLRTITKFEPILAQTLGFYLFPPLPARYLQEYSALLWRPEIWNKMKIVKDINIIATPDAANFAYHSTNDKKKVFLAKVTREELEKWAIYFIDLAVLDFSMAISRPSIVGLAALLNSITLSWLNDECTSQQIMVLKKNDNIENKTYCDSFIQLSSLLLEQLEGSGISIITEHQELQHAVELLWKLFLDMEVDHPSAGKHTYTYMMEYSSTMLHKAFNCCYDQQKKQQQQDPIPMMKKDFLSNKESSFAGLSSNRKTVSFIEKDSPTCIDTDEFTKHIKQNTT